MNAELFHDALSMLDDDLIEAVDAIRKKRRPRYFARWAALAASLVIIAGGIFILARYPIDLADGASPESVVGTTGETGATGSLDYGSEVEEVVTESESVIKNVQYVRGAAMVYSPVGIIRAPSELPDGAPDYDDAFFAENELILVPMYEPSGSIRHRITDLTKLSDGKWQLTGQRIVPEVGTADVAYWQIYVEIPRGLVDGDDEIIMKWEDE